MNSSQESHKCQDVNLLTGSHVILFSNGAGKAIWSFYVF